MRFVKKAIKSLATSWGVLCGRGGEVEREEAVDNCGEDGGRRTSNISKRRECGILCGIFGGISVCQWAGGRRTKEGGRWKGEGGTFCRSHTVPSNNCFPANSAVWRSSVQFINETKDSNMGWKDSRRK